MARRLATTIVLVQLSFSPFFQCALLLVFSMLNMSYLYHCSPMKTRFDDRVAKFNEGCVVLFMILHRMLLDINQPTEIKDGIGWGLIVIAGGNIVANIGFMSYRSLNDVRDACLERRA